MPQQPDVRVTGASPRFVRRLEVALAAATGLAIVAVMVDAYQRIGAEVLQPFAPRILAAAALVVGGVTAVVAIMERRRRGLQRRATPWLLVAIGVGTILFGQMIGYLVTASWEGPFDVRTEAVPLLLGAPIFCVGLLWLSWPPGMSRSDRWAVVGDAAVAIFALLPLWLVVVVPVGKEADSAGENLMVDIDPWVQFVGAVLVVVLASTSRRTGALPIRQLILLQSATLLYVVSDLMGDLVAIADRQSGVTWSIVGYLIAVMLFVAATVRPALEADSAESVRLREWWSVLVPLTPVILLGVLLIGRRAWAPGVTLSTPARAAASLAVFALIATTVFTRVAISWQFRSVRDKAVAERLSVGAGADWFAALVADARDVVTVVDDKGVIIYQTPSVTATFGYPAGALLGRRLADFASPADGGSVAQLLLRATMDESDRGPHEVIVRDNAGIPRDTETTVSPLRLLGADGFVLTTRDVSDRRLLLDQLSASHAVDPLTGISNRDGFLAHLGGVLESDRRHTAVCVLDLHGFRDVNEVYGHAVGDEVLRSVADRLTRFSTSVGAVARLGGDEFAVAVQASWPTSEVERLRRQLQAELATLSLPSGTTLPLHFAMGYTVGRDDNADPAGLVEQARLALAAAQSVGADGVAAYAPEMKSTFIERQRIERELRAALADDRILVQYQPIVEMSDDTIRGVEALVRMLDSEGNLISPVVFVPVAESIGLIHELGQQVLVAALRDVQTFAAALGRPLSVSVNVSALQLDRNLHPTVEEAMSESGIDPRQVTLELTETVLAENQYAAGQYLARLRELGCLVAMDDFGTGYSSLAYLATLPVDVIKIDRSFVMGLGELESSLVLVRTVIQLARSLGLRTVAEGVETAEQAQILRALGADRAQGYLFSKPLSSSDVLSLLAATGGRLSSTDGATDSDQSAAPAASSAPAAPVTSASSSSES